LISIIYYHYSNSFSTEKILCLSFSPNGNQLVSGSSDGQLCVWNVNDGVLLKAFQGDSEAVTLIFTTN